MNLSFLKGLARCCFALCLAWRYRRVLSGFLKKEPPRCTPILIDVSPETWYAQGIRVLVLDFDGVLSVYEGDSPLLEVDTWLSAAEKIFGDAIFVLTNLPTPERQALFDTRYPGIHLVRAARKKPYPDGIQAVLDKTGCEAHQLLLVDDRLLTGIVLAVSMGVRGCWVTKPYQNFDLHPIKERYVTVLRYLDQCCLKAMLFF
jgi:predicted HAD superfamily phosphohydrolase YqeG